MKPTIYDRIAFTLVPQEQTREPNGRFARTSASVVATPYDRLEQVADVPEPCVETRVAQAQERLAELRGRTPLSLPQMLATLDSLAPSGRDTESDLFSWLDYHRASYRRGPFAVQAVRR
jgi:hypothetical protein